MSGGFGPVNLEVVGLRLGECGCLLIPGASNNLLALAEAAEFFAEQDCKRAGEQAGRTGHRHAPKRHWPESSAPSEARGKKRQRVGLRAVGPIRQATHSPVLVCEANGNETVHSDCSPVPPMPEPAVRLEAPAEATPLLAPGHLGPLPPLFEAGAGAVGAKRKREQRR